MPRRRRLDAIVCGALVACTSVSDIRVARAATNGSAALELPSCNATAFTQLFGDAAVAECASRSRFSFTTPSVNATTGHVTPANARAICSFPACSAVFATLKRLELPECVVFGAVKLQEDVLEPLSNQTDCRGDAVAGSSSGDGSSDAIVAPPAATVPTNANKKATHKGVAIGGIVGAVLLAGLMATMVWWRHRRNVYSECDAHGKLGGVGGELAVDGMEEDDEARCSYTTSATAATDTLAAMVAPQRGPRGATLWHDEALMAWHISADGIEDIRVIGTGGYGVVYLVRDRRGRLLASKRLVQDHVTRDKTRAFVDEIKLVATLDHPRIVAFIGAAWTTEADLQALFEYLPNGDLCTYLAKTSRADERETWDATKLQIAIDVADALVYVHAFSPPLVHRDIKSRNVLLDANFRAKLTDFGVSRFHSDALSMTTGVGTGRWLAPEVINGGGDYDERCDIYSFGMVLSEIDTHRLPFADAGLPDMAILQLVSDGKLTPTFRGSCPVALRDLALRCLAFEPTARPSAVEIAFALRNILQTEL